MKHINALEVSTTLEDVCDPRRLALLVYDMQTGITSQLKAWFDTIIRAGKTFSYGEQGPEGLLKDKRAIVVETRGGVYTTGPAASFNHQEPHLKTLLGFIGISDVQFIHAEGLDMGPDSQASGLAHAKSAIEQALDGCVEQAA